MTDARLKRVLIRHPGLARLAVVAGCCCSGRSRRAGGSIRRSSARRRGWWPGSATVRHQGIPKALQITFWELAVAFAISVVIGLAVGLAVGLSRFSNRSLMPIILLLYGTPQITILPLFILYFGIGPPSKIAFGVTHGIFPIIVTIVAGVQNIKPILMTAAHSMGASRWQIFRWVIFPHMIPTFFAGMRLGMTGVLLGVLLAELYVSTAGIGYFTQLFTQAFDPTKLLGLVSVLAAMAIALNEIVRRAEVHFGRWRTD